MRVTSFGDLTLDARDARMARFGVGPTGWLLLPSNDVPRGGVAFSSATLPFLFPNAPMFARSPKWLVTYAPI